MNCTKGYSADTILRLPMPVGPFNERYGADCFRNDLGVLACFWILALGSVFSALLLSKEVADRKLGFTLKFVFVCLIIVNSFITIFSIFAIYIPMLCFPTFAFGLVFFWLFLFGVLKLIMETVMRIMHQINKSRSILIIIGGIPAVLGLTFVYVFGFSLQIVSVICAGIFVLTGDISLAVVFWGISCVALSVSVLILTVTIAGSFGRFADLIEKISSDAGNVANAFEVQQGDRIHEVVKRFRRGRILIFCTSPLGFGVWLLNAFILPLFWYLAFLQLLNVVFLTFVVWYLYTTPRRRKEISKMLCFCLKKRKETNFSTGNLTIGAKFSSAAI